MRLLYLTYHGFDPASGITKKILAQVEGLRQCGHEVHVCSYDFDARGHRCRFIDGRVLEDYGRGMLAALRKRVSYDRILQYCMAAGIEAVYVRSFHNANPWTVHLFRRLRRQGIRSYMEVPTYPYDQEYLSLGLRQRLALTIDQVYRRELAQQMEAIVTFSDAETIFGQRTICISNGIDFDSVPLRQPVSDPDGAVHLLGVAEVHPWHGYDRLIRGLAAYYRQGGGRKVCFHIVGEVSPADRQAWDAYIKEEGIAEYVLFHGQQHGDVLTDFFCRATFGIGSLARHRSGIDRIKTLKNREYAARGLAFIYSETDDDFDHQPYVLKAPADESPIDIDRILHFIDTHRFDSARIRQSILHLSWREQMGKVF